MDHQPPNTPEFHRRGLLLVHALGGPLRRVTLIGGIVAAVVGAAVIVALGTGAPFQAAALAGIVGGVAGTVVAILAMPRRIRSAFEAFSWLGRRELDRLHERTGTGPMANAAEGAAWLEQFPPSPAASTFRIEMLAVLGRTPEARAELAALPPPASDIEAVERTSNAGVIEFIESGRFDPTDIDALGRTLAPGSPAALELAVSRALWEARWRRARQRAEWADPLVVVRRRLGSARFRVMLRDTWSRVFSSCVIVAAVAALVTQVVPR